jgi:hypothetical protein
MPGADKSITSLLSEISPVPNKGHKVIAGILWPITARRPYYERFRDLAGPHFHRSMRKFSVPSNPPDNRKEPE